MLLPCDFCTSKPATLYCSADSAKFCLSCDQQVHSANSLSSKHSRTRLCDNRKAELVSVRSSRDNLLLCQQYCDHDCFNNSSVPVEGFSGCPSAIELAYVVGCDSKVDSFLDLNSGSCMADPEMMNFQEHIVPESGESSVSSVLGRCEREKQEGYEKLVEIRKREVVRMSDGAKVEPWMLSSISGQQINLESLEMEDEVKAEFMHQQMPCASLLMLPNDVDLRESDPVAEADLMRDCNPALKVPQIWDFQQGRSWDCEEPGPKETRFCANDSYLITKNYSGQTEDTFMTTTHQALQSMYKMDCSSVCEDSMPNNKYSNQPLSSSGTTEEESNNLPVRRSLPESRNVHVMEQPLLLAVGETSVCAKPIIDLEVLAQNRDKAMRRYKEKKKNRRFDKCIRYESRKARADTRKREKGRFVKASESPDVEV
ncbi:zf-B_box domain-containing protein/CCT domain-containing protein [Cephalotus follicularis]|uniref:Zf-B_box domain-containing protein/CCT domain-containing protein n=1 Tax=Cephalotus follicularis TaxID=3775 RepID=A0A1Q3CAV1_CEPFO|nr:zf-B_box domain-containing protein/CCT domain-containing protein [Cephalotus follicularis]